MRVEVELKVSCSSASERLGIQTEALHTLNINLNVWFNHRFGLLVYVTTKDKALKAQKLSDGILI
jgi:hypothetical protein